MYYFIDINGDKYTSTGPDYNGVWCFYCVDTGVSRFHCIDAGDLNSTGLKEISFNEYTKA